MEKSTQHIKDFKLAIEFKYLMKHAPAGVYLMPEFDNIRKLNGVIFIRRGLYRDGVFRFRMNLPMAYNDVDTHPEIIFTPPVFHPLINPVTGVLDLRKDEYLKQWQPERHFIVTAITFLKRIFYMKSFESFLSVPNEEAKSLHQNNKDEYWNRVSEAVEQSLQKIHTPPSLPFSSQCDGSSDSIDDNCTLIFTEPKPAHDDVIRKVLYGEKKADADATTGGDITNTNSTGTSTNRNSSNSANNSKGMGDTIESDNLRVGSTSSKKVIRRDDEEDQAEG